MYFKYFYEVDKLITIESIKINDYNISLNNNVLYNNQVKDYIHVLYGQYPDLIDIITLENTTDKKLLAIAVLKHRNKSIIFGSDKSVLLLLNKGIIYDI